MSRGGTGRSATNGKGAEAREGEGARHELVFQQIVNAAAELFAARGFAGTSLQDIADAVGLSRSALYYYVDSKTAVLEGLVENVTLTAANLVEAAAKRDDLDNAEKLRIAVVGLVKWVLERSTLFRLVDRSEAELPEKVAATHETAKRRVLRGLMTIIADGIRSGEFRPTNERVAALSIVGMCNWAAWWYSDRTRESREEIAQVISDLATAAVCRPGDRRPGNGDPAGALALLREDLDYLERLLQAPPKS